MITAVIPVHNRADLLGRLLATVRAQVVRFAEIIAVDNGSTDAAAQVAAEHGCRVVSMGRNAGFAAAVNVGWRLAQTEWVAVLNSDVELDPHWTERLLRAARSASFATGTILNACNRKAIDGTYDLMSRAGCAWRAGYGSDSTRIGDETREIAMAPATACLYRREVLAELGGLDESFGSYLEDVELGLRCIRAGIHGVYVPDALAWHHGSATLGRWNPRVVRLISRNQLLLIARHYDTALFRQSLLSIVAGQLLWGVVALRHGAFGAWCAGKLEGLRNFRLKGQPSPRLRAFLESSEQEIRDRATDPYWRWYFRLAPSLTHRPRVAHSGVAH